MRTALATVANRRAGRQRSTSVLSALPPAQHSNDYLPALAACAASIVYKSPLPSPEGHPIFIINAAALPDTFDVDYDSLLPYVLARLPDEDDLIHGIEYEIIFFAGGQPDSATSERKQGPGIGWYLQAYHVLSRAMRKRLQRLYIVHPRTWIRVLISVFSTVVSPKFRRKIVHVSDLSALEKHTPIVNLLIPTAAFVHDRKLEEEIDTMSNGLVFGTRHCLPIDIESGQTRLPRILRETTTFLQLGSNIRTEGLFRIPPHSVLADVLKEAYDRGQRFIIWKEGTAMLAQPGIDKDLLDEITTDNSYGVHLAAALIKTWYRELREPIFPETSYAYLRSKLSSNITNDDLLVLLDPRSATSVLTTTSREIVVRHLLPMLALVAEHEQDNKMSASNLSICFAMALLRGSDQMEDVKMTSIIKSVLESAILHWEELRKTLGMSMESFLTDIDAPAKARLYEDPMPEEQPPYTTVHRQTNRRITENTVADALHLPRIVQRLPLVSRPHEIIKETTAPPIPKRKPAPSIAVNADLPSPRDSQIITNEFTDTASAYNQQDTNLEITSTHKIPKRKALSGEGLESAGLESAGLQHLSTAVNSPILVDDSTMSALDQTPPVLKDKPVVFRKPSWPASANRIPDKLPSLAKPMLPGIRRPLQPPLSNNLTSPSLPKPRAPSPGLLQRMNTIESLNSDKATSPDEERRYKIEPGKLSLKKTSVDDLRRLYEDRLSTIDGLAKADFMKRSNSQS